MYKGKTVLSIIPARGGSKGLPGKNVKLLCGKPLIAWSIELAQESSVIDEVIVSTDSQQIATVAKSYGAHVPFTRPSTLAEDKSTTFDVVKHAIDFYRNEMQKDYPYFILLEPTSPIRDVADIDLAIKVLIDTPDADSIVGVSRTECQNPEFLMERDALGFLNSYINSPSSARRQDISDIFFLDGSLYASSANAYIDKGTFYHDKTLGHVLDKIKSFEIDDYVDFIIVEALMNARLAKIL